MVRLPTDRTTASPGTLTASGEPLRISPGHSSRRLGPMSLFSERTFAKLGRAMRLPAITLRLAGRNAQVRDARPALLAAGLRVAAIVGAAIVLATVIIFAKGLLGEPARAAGSSGPHPAGVPRVAATTSESSSRAGSARDLDVELPVHGSPPSRGPAPQSEASRELVHNGDPAPRRTASQDALDTHARPQRSTLPSSGRRTGLGAPGEAPVSTAQQLAGPDPGPSPTQCQAQHDAPARSGAMAGASTRGCRDAPAATLAVAAVAQSGQGPTRSSEGPSVRSGPGGVGRAARRPAGHSTRASSARHGDEPAGDALEGPSAAAPTPSSPSMETSDAHTEQAREGPGAKGSDSGGALTTNPGGLSAIRHPETPSARASQERSMQPRGGEGASPLPPRPSRVDPVRHVVRLTPPQGHTWSWLSRRGNGPSVTPVVPTTAVSRPTSAPHPAAVRPAHGTAGARSTQARPTAPSGLLPRASGPVVFPRAAPGSSAVPSPTGQASSGAAGVPAPYAPEGQPADRGHPGASHSVGSGNGPGGSGAGPGPPGPVPFILVLLATASALRFLLKHWHSAAVLSLIERPG